MTPEYDILEIVDLLYLFDLNGTDQQDDDLIELFIKDKYAKKYLSVSGEVFLICTY
jgi:hypothetical protein